MSIARAIAMLGAGANGYEAGVDEKLQRQRQAQQDAWNQETRDRQRVQWQRDDQQYANAQADQQAARAAMAPVTATPDMGTMADGSQQQITAPDPTTDNIDVGQPGTAPGIPMSTVQGQSGLSPSQAAAATAAANAPGARMARAAAAVQDPMLAAKMADQAQSSQLTALQLNAAQQQAVSQAFDRQLGDSFIHGDWDQGVKFLNDSAADGKGGAVKFAKKVSDDGSKVTLYPTGPDGTALNQGLTFDNNAQGLTEAAFTFAKGTSIAQKADHFQALTKEAREGRATDALAGYHQALATEAGRRVDAMFDKNDAMREKAKSGVERMSEADKLQFLDLNKQLDQINGARTTAQAQGMWDPASPGSAALLKQEAGLIMQRKALLTRYMDGDAPPAADPLGLRKQPTTRQPTGMEKVAQGMAANGDQSANFDIGGAKGTIVRPGAAAAPAAPPPNPGPPPPPQSSMAEAAGSSTDPALEKVMNGVKAQIAKLNEGVVNARAQLTAVARSGDPVALNRYAQQLQQLVSARDQFAAQGLGNAAPAFLATLPQ